MRGLDTSEGDLKNDQNLWRLRSLNLHPKIKFREDDIEQRFESVEAPTTGET